MAEATTTRPRRSRAATGTTAAAKTTPAKAAPAKAAKPAATKPAAAEAPAPDDGRVRLELEYVSDTANYSKFAVPGELKGTMVGSIYAPLGTSRVVILVVSEEAEKAAE